MEKKKFLERIALFRELHNSGAFRCSIHPVAREWNQSKHSAGDSDFVSRLLVGFLDNLTEKALPEFVTSELELSHYIPLDPCRIDKYAMWDWASSCTNRAYMFEAVEVGGVNPRARKIHLEGLLMDTDTVESAMCIAGMWYQAHCISELIMTILLGTEVLCA